MSPDPVPRTPDRRREDPRLQEILDVLEDMRKTELRIEGRMGVVEREIGRTRQLRELVKADAMSEKQLGSFIEMSEQWVNERERRVAQDTKLNRRSLLSTVLQGVIALLLALLTLFTWLHQITVNVK
jgi:hypothetical protein